MGQTKGALIQVNLTANTDLHTVEEFRRLVIREQDGAIVRLEDIGQIALGAEDYEAEVHFLGADRRFMGCSRCPMPTPLMLSSGYARKWKQSKNLPSGMSARIAYDATDYINNAIREVLKTLIDTLLIVMVVIFLFLVHSARCLSRSWPFRFHLSAGCS